MEHDIYQRELGLRHQTIDSAALAGAAIAAALSVFGAPGPYVPLNGAVGLTVLIILFTYELRRYRTRWQNLAFGSVCALASLLVVGFVAEFYQSGWNSAYWVRLEQEPRRSEVNYWFMLISWAILTAVFSVIGYKCSYKIHLPSVQPEKEGE